MLLALMISAAIAAPTNNIATTDGLTIDANGMVTPVTTIAPEVAFAGANATGSGDDGTDGTDGTDGGGDGVYAQVRFINLAPTETPAQFDVLHVDSLTRVNQTLYQTQGSAYETIRVDGETQITITNTDGDGDVWGVETGLSWAEGGHYSVAFTAEGYIHVLQDDVDAIPADRARIRYVNAAQTDAEVLILNWNGVGWATYDVFNTAVGDANTAEYPYVTEAQMLEVWHPESGGLLIDWNSSDFVQLGQGLHTNVYYWYQDDCSFLSLTCAPMILGHWADGSTAMVEGMLAEGSESFFGWSPP